ncbi:hypothetical protein F5Y13DRAFT_194418 [Hypoxylon sp. FL1857]|nr:hypothetical protein F5Y13DRAFT_194418 [Hypoxylon sp. FL1857]
MASNETNSDFQAIVNAAAAKWYSQRSTSSDLAQPNHDGIPQQAGSDQGTDVNRELARKTAWHGTLEALPDEQRNMPLPLHLLTQALAMHPALRLVEWNKYRLQGGFKPRTPFDYSSLMIYVSGQVNPNPCRNCRQRNGPFAQCIVAPPAVLALSNLKHACANCTYQSQHKKCTNLPIDEEELVTNSRIARPSWKHRDATAMMPPGRRRRGKYKVNHGHMIRKPTAQGISAESFANKLHQVRSWSPRSRRRMRAEAMQWQAAITTIEAEDADSSPSNHTIGVHGAFGTSTLPASLPPASHPSSTPSVQRVLTEMEVEGYNEGYSQQQVEDDEYESSEEGGYEDTIRVSSDHIPPMLKPPLD